MDQNTLEKIYIGRNINAQIERETFYWGSLNETISLFALRSSILSEYAMLPRVRRRSSSHFQLEDNTLVAFLLCLFIIYVVTYLLFFFLTLDLT